MKGVHEVADPPHPISPGPRQQLWDANYGLAISLARRFATRARGESVDDLTQVASIGLIRAIERYDSTRGVPFPAFAAATIVGELKHHLRDSSWMVRPSRRVQDMYLRVAEEQRGLVLELGRDPTPAELGERVGATPDDVIEALQAGRLRYAISLDSSPFGDDSSRAEQLASKDRAAEAVDDRMLLNQLLDQLPQRERRIIRLRFLGNLTQVEIAEEMGLSQAHVQRLLLRTLNQLRLQAAAS